MGTRWAGMSESMRGRDTNKKRRTSRTGSRIHLHSTSAFLSSSSSYQQPSLSPPTPLPLSISLPPVNRRIASARARGYPLVCLSTYEILVSCDGHIITRVWAHRVCPSHPQQATTSSASAHHTTTTIAGQGAASYVRLDSPANAWSLICVIPLLHTCKLLSRRKGRGASDGRE